MKNSTSKQQLKVGNLISLLVELCIAMMLRVASMQSALGCIYHCVDLYKIM